MREQFFVRKDFLAPFVGVTALEDELAEQIPSHSIHAIELTFLSAERASVGILLEPTVFAIAAEWLFAGLALDGILKDIVADTADEFREECFDLGGVEDLVLLVDVLLVLFGLIYQTVHLL